MKSQRSRIFRSNNRRGQSKNGKEEGAGSYRVASAKKYERCVEVFGASKLL